VEREEGAGEGDLRKNLRLLDVAGEKIALEGEGKFAADPQKTG